VVTQPAIATQTPIATQPSGEQPPAPPQPKPQPEIASLTETQLRLEAPLKEAIAAETEGQPAHPPFLKEVVATQSDQALNTPDISNLSTEERRYKIASLYKRKSNKELAQMFDVAPSTISRDINWIKERYQNGLGQTNATI
jgi:predicted HTH transcriptional regulator